MALHNAEIQAMTRHQRAVERMVVVITYPACLYVLLSAILLWVGVNLGLQLSGYAPFDRAPFGWLQTGVTVLAFLMTSIIVITQSRQGKVAERSAHLNLQISLLVDQKIAKVIQLMEEMRHDSPTLRNRRDELAEEMQVAVDPSQIASMIAIKMSVTDNLAEDLDTGEQRPPLK